MPISIFFEMLSKLDKSRLIYVIGLLQLIITPLMVAYSIKGAKMLHLFKFLTFMPFKYFEFRKRNWHYFLTEFCYYTSIIFNLFLVQDLFFGGPLNNYFIPVYCITSGPILFAIFLNKDKLYLHSHSHLCSLYLHLTPALMTWMMRWHNDTTDYVELYPPQFEWNAIQNTSCHFIRQCIYFYIPWSLMYFMYMFIIKRKDIYEKDNLTMYRLYVENDNNNLCRYVNKLDNYILKAFIYMFVHFIGNMLLATIAVVMFHCFYLNTFIIISAFISSAWSGSYKMISLLIKAETEEKMETEKIMIKELISNKNYEDNVNNNVNNKVKEKFI